jgi:hypothetical protein
MAHIDRRPSWILPFVLLLTFNFAVTFVVYRVLVTDANFDQVALAKIQWEGSAQGSIAQQIDSLRGQRERWYFLPLFAVVISTLALSVFFYLVLRLARAGPTFLKVFCVVCWSFVIYRVVGGTLTIIALLVRGRANFFPAAPEAWSPTSLAHLVSRTAVNHNIYSAISKLDVFLVWWLVVLAIGFSKTSRNLSVARSAAIVAICEVGYLALNALGALPGV